MKKSESEIVYYFLLFSHTDWFRSSNQWPHFHCLPLYPGGPQQFCYQGLVSWKITFPWAGQGGGGGGYGFEMIQGRHIYCALYFSFVAISGCAALTSGLGFTLLWESNVAADLRGGRTWVVMWAKRNRWSCPPAPPHLLLCGLVSGAWDHYSTPSQPWALFSFTKCLSLWLNETTERARRNCRNHLQKIHSNFTSNKIGNHN